MNIWIGLFLVSLGCCIGYVLASMVYAGKLDDEKQEMEARAVRRLRSLQNGDVRPGS